MKTKEQKLSNILDSLGLKYIENIDVSIPRGVVHIDFVLVDTVGVFVLNFRDTKQGFTPFLQSADSVNAAIKFLLKGSLIVSPKYIQVADKRWVQEYTDLTVVHKLRSIKKVLRTTLENSTEVLTSEQVSMLYKELCDIKK